MSPCKIWWILDIGKVIVSNFKVCLIEHRWNYEMGLRPSRRCSRPLNRAYRSPGLTHARHCAGHHRWPTLCTTLPPPSAAAVIVGRLIFARGQRGEVLPSFAFSHLTPSALPYRLPPLCRTGCHRRRATEPRPSTSLSRCRVGLCVQLRCREELPRNEAATFLFTCQVPPRGRATLAILRPCLHLHDLRSHFVDLTGSLDRWSTSTAAVPLCRPTPPWTGSPVSTPLPR
jgi:hypothetical protein